MAMNREMVFNEMAPIVIAEGRRHAVALVVMFAIIALAALVVGVLWPKKYVSSTTILAQKSDIIRPLMEGRAVATGVSDRVAIAQAGHLQPQGLDIILETGGWMATHPDPIAQDRLMEQIKDRTLITSPRET